MAAHVFILLFMRTRNRHSSCAIVLVAGWLFVALIVGLGPLAIQTSAKGAYFGPSGYW